MFFLLVHTEFDDLCIPKFVYIQTKNIVNKNETKDVTSTKECTFCILRTLNRTTRSVFLSLRQNKHFTFCLA